MKLAKLLVACTLAFGVANAQDVMQKSMSIMEQGMTQIQKGFLNNNLELIKEGSALVKQGNELFSEKKVIENYLPQNKKHLVNVAAAASERISLDLNVLELNLDEKAYLSAADAYSDMLNACSRCHSIVRSW
ncbi:hypothetical protein [Arcobacter roscoffensis]|uniref:Cytochrome C n=1 Tax=Arcobacter roscoffensis TaxID=2961520 RepID=A0ABY5E833_9BACT|nr:hypothetical protein [Arcobacter roscoffensis]MAC83822.1 hypothetical protein [Arcobacter sp.]UTJ06890.1 hypothetical protein NJU99_02025 [Arcobacter roscoffensis]|tara:strand:- start:160 stop:555 length:396 start_codon:yes stop_codon:yes gene_type:complete